MTISPRGLMALVIAPVLVIGLAGCGAPSSASPSGANAGSSPTDSDAESSPGDPSAAPTAVAPEIESSAEPESGPDGGADEAPVFTAVAPVPRLPVDCEQLFSSIAGLSGSPGKPTIVGLAREAALAQVGFLDCEFGGDLSGSSTLIRVIVGVDIPRTVAQGGVDAAAAAGHHTGLGAELSYSNCGKVEASTQCRSGVYANGYFAEVSFLPLGYTAASYVDATLRFTRSLADRIASWGTPRAAWTAPANALRWATDCATDVASTDSEIVAAIPFPIGSPKAAATDDGFALTAIADDRAGVTWCEWGSGPSVFVFIVPGASWRFGQPGALVGTPFAYPGALATFSVQPVYSESQLMLVVDDSLLLVSVGSQYYQPKVPTEQLSSIPLDVAEAIIAEFGNR